MARTHMYTTVTSQRPGTVPHAHSIVALNFLPLVHHRWPLCSPSPAIGSGIPDTQPSKSPPRHPESPLLFKRVIFLSLPPKIPLLFDGAAGELITIPTHHQIATVRNSVHCCLIPKFFLCGCVQLLGQLQTLAKCIWQVDLLRLILLCVSNRGVTVHLNVINYLGKEGDRAKHVEQKDDFFLSLHICNNAAT